MLWTATTDTVVEPVGISREAIPERAGGAQLGDAGLVEAEHVGHDVVGVLADRRGLVGTGELLADDLDSGSGSCSAPTCSTLQNGRRCWNCGSSATVWRVLTGAMVVLCSSPNADPLGGGPGLEDVAQLGLELEVVAGVVGVPRPGQRSNRSVRSMPSQKFFQNACSDAMNSTWPSAVSYIW